MKEFFYAHKKAFRTVATLSVALLLLFCVLIFAACGNSTERNQPYASVSDDFRTDYYVGESLELRGNLKMYLDATTFSEIPITEEMVSGFNTSTAGTVIVKVTYGEFVASVAVTVHPLKATSITLDADTVPRTLYKDKAFPSTVTFSAVFSDGTTADGLTVTPSMLGGFDPSYVGTQNVSVTYLGASTSFIVNVKKDARVSIELMDEKKQYVVGEPLSVTGAQIKVTYESGNINYATLLVNNVSEFSTAKGGEFVAKVTYSGLECEYKYFVRKTVASFALTASSLPAIYEKGDVFPDTGEGVLTYDDGTSDTISLNSENFPDFSTATAGEKQIEVVVSGVKDSYSYRVLPTIVSATPFGFTAAVRQNSDFDGLGELIVIYENAPDGSEQRESIPLSTVTATKEIVVEATGDRYERITTDRLVLEYRTSDVGDIIQKVFFRRCTTNFAVCVYPEDENVTAVESISLSGTFSPIVWGDPIDATGVQVGINYKYLAPDIVDCQAAWVTLDLPEEIEGDYMDVPLTVTYSGATVDGRVRVLSAEYAARVTSISVSGMRSLYVVGDELATESMRLFVVYGGGRSSSVLPFAEAVFEFDSSSAGEKRMTVTYGGQSCEVFYRLIGEEDKTRVTDISVANFSPLLFVGDTVMDIDCAKYKAVLTLGYGYASSSIPLNGEGVTLSGGPFDEAGLQTILLSYGEVQKELTVEVHALSDKDLVTAIAVIPDTVMADVGVAPDLSQVVLTVTYGYGYRKETILLGSSEVSVDSSMLDLSREGLSRATATYRGCTCGFFVNFVSGSGDNVLRRIEIESGSKSAYTEGDELSGVNLILYYKNGLERLPVTADMAPDFSTDIAGAHSVTISYGGKGVVYNYTVTAQQE